MIRMHFGVGGKNQLSRYLSGFVCSMVTRAFTSHELWNFIYQEAILSVHTFSNQIASERIMNIYSLIKGEIPTLFKYLLLSSCYVTELVTRHLLSLSNKHTA